MELQIHSRTEDGLLRSLILVTVVYPVFVVTVFSAFLFLLNLPSATLPPSRWIACYWFASIGVWCLLLTLLAAASNAPAIDDQLPVALKVDQAAAGEDLRCFSGDHAHKRRLESTTSSFAAQIEDSEEMQCSRSLLQGYESSEPNFPDVVVRVTSPSCCSDSDEEIKQLQECWRKNEHKQLSESSTNVMDDATSLGKDVTCGTMTTLTQSSVSEVRHDGGIKTESHHSSSEVKASIVIHLERPSIHKV